MIKNIEIVPFNSCTSTGSPVAEPVNITPSTKKNSAALTVSDMLISDVIACELHGWKNTKCNNKIKLYILKFYLCFFLISAKIRILFASIYFL